MAIGSMRVPSGLRIRLGTGIIRSREREGRGAVVVLTGSSELPPRATVVAWHAAVWERETSEESQSWVEEESRTPAGG